MVFQVLLHISGDKSLQGAYYATIEEFVSCKGPKSVDVSRFNTNISKVENSFIGFLNITILADTQVDQV